MAAVRGALQGRRRRRVRCYAVDQHRRRTADRVECKHRIIAGHVLQCAAIQGKHTDSNAVRVEPPCLDGGAELQRRRARTGDVACMVRVSTDNKGNVRRAPAGVNGYSFTKVDGEVKGCTRAINAVGWYGNAADHRRQSIDGIVVRAGSACAGVAREVGNTRVVECEQVGGFSDARRGRQVGRPGDPAVAGTEAIQRAVGHHQISRCEARHRFVEDDGDCAGFAGRQCAVSYHEARH